jgi:hypothetical protein
VAPLLTEVTAGAAEVLETNMVAAEAAMTPEQMTGAMVAMARFVLRLGVWFLISVVTSRES